MSVATATEYAAQVAGTASPRRIPSSPPETSCPEPSATSATPSDETAAAIQKRRVSRSRPSTIPKRPAKMGITPSRSPTVEAALTFSASTNASWLSHRITAAATSSPRCRRSIRSDRSVASPRATNTRPASP